MLDLEWRRAVEPTGPVGAARRPSQTRRAWVHRAPESQVVSLFARVSEAIAEPPAPWWLRALAAGNLRSRLGGFSVEDQIADVLDERPGWAYVPWIGPGEDGYWEYTPSERAAGAPRMPTTLMFTDRHPGWVDVVPAYEDDMPEPVAIAGSADLRARLDEIERI
ncbi:MAG TPA: hypothetical protein VF444_05425 [Pseudonocardiaceae bacterium]